MNLQNFKMSQKLIGGFVLVVVILGLAIGYQLLTLQKLAVLQDEGASRANDSLKIGTAMQGLDSSYGVMADAVINRQLDRSKKEFAELKEQAATNMAMVRKLVDTPEEIAWADDYAKNYQDYLNLFENKLLPLLESDNPEQAAIMALDEQLDVFRGAADTPLNNITKSLANEMTEADEHFDAVRTRSIMISIILSIVGAIVALVLAFTLTHSITKPILNSVKNLSTGSEQVAAASSQVASASQSLAEGATEQAANLEETTASMEEMSSMTRANADNASQADSLMKEALKTINDTNISMNQMSDSMTEISSASEETFKIIKTIDEIAFQTNLLALNAAVEAARAGEAGAGFAVVADEVRNLAMRATEAAKNTANLIEGTVQKVNAGKEIVTRAGDAFQQVAESSNKVGNLIGEISVASKEQAIGFKQISEAVTQMDGITQQNSASAEESAAASEELSAQAETMMDVVRGLYGLVEGAQSAMESHTNTKKTHVAVKRAKATGMKKPAAPKRLAIEDTSF